MRGVERIQVQVASDTSRAADPGNNGHLIQVEPRVVQGPGETVQGRANSAARTPNVRNPVLPQKGHYRIILFHGFNWQCASVAHRVTSKIFSRICWGSWTVPPA